MGTHYPESPPSPDPKGPGRLTTATKAVLTVFLNDTTAEMYISQIGEAAGLGPGSVHPILARLENCGWLVSRWEDVDPHAQRRPRRRYFKLTGDGEVYAYRELERAKARLRATYPAVRPQLAPDEG